MKKFLTVLVALIIIVLSPKQTLHAKSYEENYDIKPAGKIEWSINATEVRKYPQGQVAPSQIYVTRSQGGYTYSGYIQRQYVNYDSINKIQLAYYSGYITLNQ